MNILNPDRFNGLPDAFLFDMDNTFYPYEPAHAAAIKAVRYKVISTFSIGEADFDDAYNEAQRQIKFRLNYTASSHSRLLYFQRMLEIMGLGSQVLLALDFEQTYWRTFLSNAVLFEGVKDVLDEIRLLGIPMAIVTDLTAQIQFRKIVYFGLDHYFDYIVTSEEVGHDKPHEAPFKIAIEKIQPKGNCIWMVGDDPVKDISGAQEKINAITLLKADTSFQVNKNRLTSDLIFNDFRELKTLIIRLAEASSRAKT